MWDELRDDAVIKVKICGIRKLEDIRRLNAYLPDYAGFIFAESRRRVTPETARTLIAALDRRVRRAGVFVNEDIRTVCDICAFCGLDILQLHGDESPGYVAELSRRIFPKRTVRIWKAFRVRDDSSLAAISAYKVDAFLLDAYSDRGYGGSGKTFDWRLAKPYAGDRDVVLAGGLDPDNIREAISVARPFAVDVSSGVESGGEKDAGKIRDFIYSVRGSMY